MRLAAAIVIGVGRTGMQLDVDVVAVVVERIGIRLAAQQTTFRTREPCPSSVQLRGHTYLPCSQSFDASH